MVILLYHFLGGIKMKKKGRYFCDWYDRYKVMCNLSIFFMLVVMISVILIWVKGSISVDNIIEILIPSVVFFVFFKAFIVSIYGESMEKKRDYAKGS